MDELTLKARLLAKRDTTAAWNAKSGFIPKNGEIIIYTDHETIVDGSTTKYVPGVKIGDGLAYLIDLPFSTDAVSKELIEHKSNSTIHVTSSDKNFWNNKLNCEVVNDELIFNRM